MVDGERALRLGIGLQLTADTQCFKSKKFMNKTLYDEGKR